MTPTTTVRLPKLDQDMTEGHVLEWLVEDGAEVAAGAPICVIETDKVSTELVAEGPGIVRIVIEAGQTAPIGAVLAVVGEDQPEGSLLTKDELGMERDQIAAPEQVDNLEATAAPLTRHVVAAREGDVSVVLPVNRQGWVRPHTVSPRWRRGPGSAVSANASMPTASAVPAMETVRPQEIGHALEQSRAVQQFAIRVLVPAERLRAVVTGAHARGLDHVSLTHVLVKAAAATLREQPALNVHYDDARCPLDEISINLLLADSEPALSPCIRNADRLSLAETADQARALKQHEQTEVSYAESVTPGSITLSNLGVFGIDEFTPRLTPPQVAVLGIGRVDETQHFWATLVVDPRAVTDAQAARWLAVFKQFCSEPALIL
jgi:pyruvate dehydrogenase E2 component (dihydrolipoamide acetyltransferase)